MRHELERGGSGVRTENAADDALRVSVVLRAVRGVDFAVPVVRFDEAHVLADAAGFDVRFMARLGAGRDLEFLCCADPVELTARPCAHGRFSFCGPRVRLSGRSVVRAVPDTARRAPRPLRRRSRFHAHCPESVRRRPLRCSLPGGAVSWCRGSARSTAFEQAARRARSEPALPASGLRARRADRRGPAKSETSMPLLAR